MLFHVFGIYVLSGAENYDLLRAASNRKIAVAVYAPQVSGVEPSVFQYGFSRLRILVISLHYHGPPDGHLPNTLFVGTDDFDLRSLHGAPHRTGFPPVNGIKGHDWRCLRKAVALHYRETQGLHVTHYLRLKPRAAACEKAELSPELPREEIAAGVYTKLFSYAAEKPD